jgi:uncharacterized membrane protein HdeD (DUF308 family)
MEERPVTQQQQEFRLERKRTGWDIALGLLSAVLGVVVLGNVALASAVSIVFLGWLALIGGIAIFVAALVQRGPGMWWGVAGGAVLAVLGFGFLRNPTAGLLTLTLLAGSMFLVGGIFRLFVAFQPGAPRGLLIFSGIVTIVLGLMVLFQFPYSAVWFLGVMLGVQLLVDGLTMAISGRVRVVPSP